MIKFPISKIVLEGCDLSGKTSLYNSIHKGSGFRWNIEDRSTLSMCIYANQYGRDDYYHRKNLALELSNLNNHMVLLHPDLDVIHNRYLDRGDEFQDVDSLIDLHKRFSKEFEKICMLPNVHAFTAGTLEEQTERIINNFADWETRTPEQIGRLAYEFAKFSPNRECTTMQFHFYDDGTFEEASKSILDTPGEEQYYKNISDRLLAKIKKERAGLNQYDRQEPVTSRRFVFSGEECISFIQVLVRDGLMDVHAVFRSSDTERKTFTDVQFVHYLGREVFRLLRLNPDQHRVRFRFNINSAHVLSQEDMFKNLNEKRSYELRRDKFRHDLALQLDKALHLVEQGEWGTELKRALAQAAYAHDSMSYAEYKLKQMSDPKHRSTEYPLNTLSPPIKPTDMTKVKQQSIAVTNHYVKKEYARLQEQADVIMRQFHDLDRRVKITEVIMQAKMRIKPVVGHSYWLYRKRDNTYVVSLIGKDSWASGCPHEFVAEVQQLGDSTWEVIEVAPDFEELLPQKES